MRYRIHLVPNDSPNDEGRWECVELRRIIPADCSFTGAVSYFEGHYDEALEHIVRYEKLSP